MSKAKADIVKLLKSLNQQKEQILAATVISVSESAKTATVEADGIEYVDVRLTSVNDNIEKSVIIPSLESWVIIAFIENSQTDAVVIAYSAIDKIIIKSEKLNIIIDIKNGKFKIANADVSLIDIFSSLITELKNAIITTPAGAGSISPTTVTKLNAIENKFKQLFN